MEALKPLVFKKGGKQRLGKGFSLNELKKVGLKPKRALKLRIPVDTRRKTVHDENVEKLKKLLETKQQKAQKPKEKPEQKAEQKKEKTKKRGKKEKSKT